MSFPQQGNATLEAVVATLRARLNAPAQPVASTQAVINWINAKVAAQKNHHNVEVRSSSPTTPPPAPMNGRCQGVVKSFHAERGYGWMSCPTVGRDVFVHANDLQSLEARQLLPFVPGTTLEFDIEQRPRGLSAINVVVVAVPQAPVSLVAETAAVRQVQRLHNTNTSLVSSRPVAMGRRFQGTIVYYTPSKGYGFVQTSSLPGKVYVHIYALEKFNVSELRVGMVIEFGVRENQKGKYACNVKLLRDVAKENDSASNMHAVSMWEGRHHGTLKSFDAKRSLGWIQYDNTEVFMHIYEILQDNAEDRLRPGVELEFSIGMHGRGLTAYDIDIMGAPSASLLRTTPAQHVTAMPNTLPCSISQTSDDDDQTVTPPPEACRTPTTPDYANNVVGGFNRFGLIQKLMGVEQQQQYQASLDMAASLASLLKTQTEMDSVAHSEHFESPEQSEQQEDEELLSDVMRCAGVDLPLTTSVPQEPYYWQYSNLTSNWLNF